MIYAPRPFEKCNPKKKNGFALAAANRFALDHFVIIKVKFGFILALQLSSILLNFYLNIFFNHSSRGEEGVGYFLQCLLILN